MKIDILYDDTQIDVNPQDVVDLLQEEGEEITDDLIESYLSEHISQILTDDPWPSYRLGHGDRESLIKAIKQKLEQ